MTGRAQNTDPSPTLRRELHYGDRVVTCFADRPPTVDALFRMAVSAHPQRDAIVLGKTRLTYAALDAAVDAIAAHLAARGLEKGERIGVLAGNRPEFLVALLASARLGLVVVPLNTRNKLAEIQFILAQCSAVALVFDAELAQLVPAHGVVPSLRVQIVAGDGSPLSFEGVIGSGAARPPSRAVMEEDDFCLLYTSGTTGHPKGARLTHLGAVHSALNFRHAMALVDGDVSVLAVPASHVTGLIAILLTMISVAGTTIAMPEFKARRFMEIAALERMSHALLVPAMYNLCLLDPDFAAYDLSHWRIGGFGGAPMPQATIKRLATVLPKLDMRNIYGSTETTSPVTVLPRGVIATHLDTVGRSLPGADIVVMDDLGREVAVGATGELWIAGPMVIPGYWNNPEADADSFCGGYWKSGDIGSIDADGYVRILDRRKDVINRGGYKIYSIEVENALAQHPLVIESAVVPKPDSVLGETVHAFVVVRTAVEPAALTLFCRAALSDYKVPTSYTLLDQPLPRNANGKILKRELQARLVG